MSAAERKRKSRKKLKEENSTLYRENKRKEMKNYREHKWLNESLLSPRKRNKVVEEKRRKERERKRKQRAVKSSPKNSNNGSRFQNSGTKGKAVKKAKSTSKKFKKTKRSCSKASRRFWSC